MEQVRQSLSFIGTCAFLIKGDPHATMLPEYVPDIGKRVR